MNNPSKTIRIATRKSKLALWQAEWIKSKLLQFYPDLTITLIPIATTGDQWLTQPLHTIGGKGLFVKELEQALLSQEADIAVHSLKDVPSELPEGLCLSSFCKRESPEDVLLSTLKVNLSTLPKGAKVGTSSLRRQCQLLAKRPDLNMVMLRGNIDTRIRQLESKTLDAIVLAYAGIKRLGLTQYMQELFPVTTFLPAVGQGVLAIECREHHSEIQAYLKPLHHEQTACAARAERALNQTLGGSCKIPLAGYATVDKQNLTLHGLVGSPDGHRILTAQGTGPIEKPEALGFQVAQNLLEKGAKEIIESVHV